MDEAGSRKYRPPSKRLLGGSILNREVQKIIEEKRVSYRIDRHSRGTANKLGIILGEKEFSPEEISAKILEKIRLDAEASFGGEVAYAVITVPAYFNDKLTSVSSGPRQDRRTVRYLVKRLVRHSNG